MVGTQHPCYKSFQGECLLGESRSLVAVSVKNDNSGMILDLISKSRMFVR